jgi:hypothetical protein
MKNVIWLTTPEGTAYFDPNEVIGITETYIPLDAEVPETAIPKKAVRSHLHMRGLQSPFNIMEDPEVILDRLRVLEEGENESSEVVRLVEDPEE